MSSYKDRQIGDMSQFVSSLDISGDNLLSLGEDISEHQEDDYTHMSREQDRKKSTKPSATTVEDLCVMLLTLSASVDRLTQAQSALYQLINDRMETLEEKVSIISSGVGLNPVMRKNVIEESVSNKGFYTRDVLKVVPAVVIFCIWRAHRKDQEYPISYEYARKLSECLCKTYNTDVRRDLGMLFATIMDTGIQSSPQVVSTLMATVTNGRSSIMRDCCMDLIHKLSTTHAFLIPVSLVQFLGTVEKIDGEGVVHVTEMFDMKKRSFMPGELISKMSYSDITKKKHMIYLQNTVNINNVTQAKNIIRDIKGGFVDDKGVSKKGYTATTAISIDQILGRAKERTKGMSLSNFPDTPDKPPRNMKMSFTYKKS